MTYNVMLPNHSCTHHSPLQSHSFHSMDHTVAVLLYTSHNMTVKCTVFMIVCCLTCGAEIKVLFNVMGSNEGHLYYESTLLSHFLHANRKIRHEQNGSKVGEGLCRILACLVHLL